MQSHIFPFESELQNESPTPPVLAVSERLARYGADALTVEEHLALLVGGEILAAHMLKYFGSILALARFVVRAPQVPSQAQGRIINRRSPRFCLRRSKTSSHPTSGPAGDGLFRLLRHAHV
jgi:hypothetical protein